MSQASGPGRTQAPIARPGLLALAAATLLVLAAPGVAAATVDVTPTALGDWQFQHSHCGGGTSTGSQAFVSGPPVPPLGTGSLLFTIGADGDSFETFRNTAYSGTLLSSLSALSYSTYTNTTGGQAVYLNLLVSSTGSGTVDDQLFFEPLYQSGFNPAIPDQGPVLVGVWQDWDALAGGWWSLNGFAGPGTGVRTLAEYAAAFPNATITNSASGAGAIRLATGCGSAAWPGFVGHADNVTIATPDGTTTYDLDPTGTGTGTGTGTTTATGTGNGTDTTTGTSTPIPTFPTLTAIVLAAMGGVGATLIVLRRRL